MYNICVADVIVRIKGHLYNDGRIIVDRDSFDFAGKLADDFLYGHYDGENYNVNYHCYLVSKEIEEGSGARCYSMLVPYKINTLQDILLKGGLLRDVYGLSIKFLKFEYKNKSLIEEVVKENSDFIDVKL